MWSWVEFWCCNRITRRNHHFQRQVKWRHVPFIGCRCPDEWAPATGKVKANIVRMAHIETKLLIISKLFHSGETGKYNKNDKKSVSNNDFNSSKLVFLKVTWSSSSRPSRVLPNPVLHLMNSQWQLRDNLAIANLSQFFCDVG